MKPDLAAASATLEMLEARLAREIAERQRLADFFLFAPDAHVITRTDGLIIDANLAATELLRTPREALLGKPLTVFISLDRRSEFRARLRELGEGKGPLRWRSVLRPRTGAERAAQLQARATAGGALAAFCWVLSPA